MEIRINLLPKGKNRFDLPKKIASAVKKIVEGTDRAVSFLLEKGLHAGDAAESAHGLLEAGREQNLASLKDLEKYRGRESDILKRLEEWISNKDTPPKTKDVIKKILTGRAGGKMPTRRDVVIFAYTAMAQKRSGQESILHDVFRDRFEGGDDTKEKHTIATPVSGYVAAFLLLEEESKRSGAYTPGAEQAEAAARAIIQIQIALSSPDWNEKTKYRSRAVKFASGKTPIEILNSVPITQDLKFDAKTAEIEERLKETSIFDTAALVGYLRVMGFNHMQLGPRKKYAKLVEKFEAVLVKKFAEQIGAAEPASAHVKAASALRKIREQLDHARHDIKDAAAHCAHLHPPKKVAHDVSGKVIGGLGLVTFLTEIAENIGRLMRWGSKPSGNGSGRKEKDSGNSGDKGKGAGGH